MVMAHEEIEREIKKEVSINDNDETEGNESTEYRERDAKILPAEYTMENEFSEEELHKLHNLRVQLFHEVPHQHEIEKNAGYHVPTPKEERRFQKYAVLELGSYSPDEDKIIRKNWKRFCKKHDWDRQNVRPFLYLGHCGNEIIPNSEERKKFVQFLANRLPNRTLYSVYHRFRNLNDHHLQSRYTKEEEEEEEIIVDQIEENPEVEPELMHSNSEKKKKKVSISGYNETEAYKFRDPKDSDAKLLLAEYNEMHKLSKEVMFKLNDLRIQLIHDVPMQHKIEKLNGTKVPTAEEKRRFQKYAPLKLGVYGPDEDKIICKNWKEFCKVHNWDLHDVRPFLYMRHGRMTGMLVEERKKFVQFLANGLPNRTLYSVYHRFRNLNGTHSQSRYSKEEDEIILQYMDENPNLDERHMHSDLAKVLNRTRASVWRRYRLLKKKKQELAAEHVLVEMRVD